MKKIISVLLCLSILFAFVGCSKNETNNEQQPAEQTTVKTIDVDLTALSSTMIYSEVYNMMIYPDQYIGKTVKMSGQYNEYYDAESGKTYYACVIADATACCQQGLEFEVLNENDVANLNNNDSIEVVGTFGTYNEGELQYLHLTDTSINAL